MTQTPPSLPYPPTLPNVIRDCAARHGDREFIADSGRHFSYRDIEATSAELALGLVAGGVGKATRIGLLMPNCADWVTALPPSARKYSAVSTRFRSAERKSWPRFKSFSNDPTFQPKNVRPRSLI